MQNSNRTQMATTINLQLLQRQVQQLNERESDLELALNQIMVSGSVQNSTDEQEQQQYQNSEQLPPEIFSQLQNSKSVYQTQYPAFVAAQATLTDKVNNHAQTIETISNEVNHLDLLKINCDAVVHYIDDFLAFEKCLKAVSQSTATDEEHSQAIRQDFSAAVDLVVKYHDLSSRSLYKADGTSVKQMQLYQSHVASELHEALQNALEDFSVHCGLGDNSTFTEVIRLARLLQRMPSQTNNGDSFLTELLQMASPFITKRLQNKEHIEVGDNPQRETPQIELLERRLKDVLNVSFDFIRCYGGLVLRMAGGSDQSAYYGVMNVCDTESADVLSEIIAFVDNECKRLTDSTGRVAQLEWPSTLQESVGTDRLHHIDHLLNIVALMCVNVEQLVFLAMFCSVPDLVRALAGCAITKHSSAL